MQFSDFSVTTRREGGMGQRMAIDLLKEAGIKAWPTTSPYVGHTGVLVATKDRTRAERVLFGGR